MKDRPSDSPRHKGISRPSSDGNGPRANQPRITEATPASLYIKEARGICATSEASTVEGQKPQAMAVRGPPQVEFENDSLASHPSSHPIISVDSSPRNKGERALPQVSPLLRNKYRLSSEVKKD